MCGIFGYVGKSVGNELVFQGLKRLEYRGYDSWGVVVKDDDNLRIFKNIGEIHDESAFRALPSSNVVLGHTRWATHGGVTNNNAHPHLSSDGSFALVQNGIVENFSQLKRSLEKKKYKFKTQTDTEVIVRLIEEQLKHTKDFNNAVKKAFRILKGRNTIAVLRTNGDIVAIRNGSPLVIGVAKDNIYLASDTLSFAPYTSNVVYIDDNDFVCISGNDFYLENIVSKGRKEIKIKKLKNTVTAIKKEGYDHFMIKEITEQSHTIVSASDYSTKDFKPLVASARKAHRVYLVGAGTAGFAAGQIAYYLRNIAEIDAQDIRSYEFKSYLNILTNKDLVIAVSQSGETADTIEVLEVAKKRGCKIASIVNMWGTTISRMSDFKYYTNAGPEICVASTKVFTAQCSWGYVFAKAIVNDLSAGKKHIKTLSNELEKYFVVNTYKKIEVISDILKSKEHLFVLGKGENAYIALEGALKIKEISYKHIEGFMAGELKHGVIALIEKGVPVFGIISDDEDSSDIVSAMEQVKARGALTIGIGDKKFNKLQIFDYFLSVPQEKEICGISNVLPFQLISYFLSKALGNNIDKPRNLAKSVTVK